MTKEKTKKANKERVVSPRFIENYHNNLLNIMAGIQNAGGCASVVTPEMTINEFLEICACNDVEIKARHIKPEDKC